LPDLGIEARTEEEGEEEEESGNWAPLVSLLKRKSMWSLNRRFGFRGVFFKKIIARDRSTQHHVSKYGALRALVTSNEPLLRIQ
jgi:hypothetical protein